MGKKFGRQPPEGYRPLSFWGNEDNKLQQARNGIFMDFCGTVTATLIQINLNFPSNY